MIDTQASQDAVPQPTVPQAVTPPAAGSLTAVQLALHAGWTMAVLYAQPRPAPRPQSRPDRRQEPPPPPPELPTVHELPEPARSTVELGRLHHLLDCLSEQPGCAELKALAAAMVADKQEFSARLHGLHLKVLGVMASAGLQLELAYELGRSLRDTANPDSRHGESPAQQLARQLARARIARLQEWLTTLSAAFPPQAAAIASASMGRWSDFAELTVGRSPAARWKTADKDTFAQHMKDYLLEQGDVWLMILVGVRSTDGLLTPEGYVSAGEAALRRSARIIRGVLAHYWGGLLVLAVALGGILYLTVANLGGAAQVWTSIAAIGSAMGISTQSVRSVITRLGTEAERPVLAAAEEDAKAWAITTMPHADLTTRGVRRLRKSGVTKPVGLGRF